MDSRDIITIQLIIGLIQLLVAIATVVVYKRHKTVTEVGEVIAEEPSGEPSELPRTIPRNAKWFKLFKTQLRNQTTIDMQYRNGLMTIYTDQGPITYSVDGWILRRLKSIPYRDLFIFLESELGHFPKGIRIHKSATHRTPQWFRKRKRIQPKWTGGGSEDVDDDY